MKRVTLIFVVVAGLFLASFGVCLAMGWMTPEWTRDLLPAGNSRAAAGIVFLLLAADLVLPVPSSVLISAAAMVADPWLIGAAAVGGMLAGNLIGYWACRLAGRKAFERFVKPAEAGKFGKWLDRYGPGALVVSRLVPVMAETLSCMAGLARMHFGRFTAGLLIGTVPFAAFFVFVGHYWGRVQGEPGWVLAVSLAVPAAGWVLFAAFTRKPRKS